MDSLENNKNLEQEKDEYTANAGRQVEEENGIDSVCNPISKLSSLWTYTHNIPKWVNRIVELIPRGDSVVKNILSDCHIESSKFTVSTRLNSHTVPRTLVCHDMKGGYLEDRFIDPINCSNGYTFYRWAQIDLFVYFSHHLVTIPPLSWINIAHTNGVKVLGTFITEWIPGEEICQEIFANEESVEKLVKTLVDICITFKLDGWLINIENKIDSVALLEKFVHNLTQQLHMKKPGSLLIWYDSVINDGTLKWQNELNGLNRCFFDVCDGIFLNYSWKEENLKHTMETAQHRCLDVYVGVDVFGRNFYGGGNFNTYMAAQKIREYNLSMAIFAQGWTHETLPIEPHNTLLDRFFDRDNAFWRSLWPYLYTHPVNTTFETLFYTGIDKNWFNLQSQERQLSRFLHPQVCLPEYKDVPTLTEMCNCLQLLFCDNYTSCLISKQKLDQDQMYVHHLLNCNISLKGDVIFYYYSKANDLLNLVLLIKNNNQSFRKVICYPSDQETFTDNCSIIEASPLKNQDLINLIYDKHKAPLDWKLRCYMLHLENCRIMEIGVEIRASGAICLCGLGIKDL